MDYLIVCLLDGVYYPSDGNFEYGYLVDGRFLPFDRDLDLSSLPPSAQPCYRPRSSDPISLPASSQFGFFFSGLFFSSFSEMSNYRETQVSLAVFRSLQPCVVCGKTEANSTEVLSQVVCLMCLKKKVCSNELYFGEGKRKSLWTPAIVFGVYLALKKKLPSFMHNELPSCCPLPNDSLICFGRSLQFAPDYPPFGHIVGQSSICTEDGCPIPGHTLCKQCASGISECPFCGSKVLYEEVPDKCQCDEKLCYGFELGCKKCGQKPKRQKK